MGPIPVTPLPYATDHPQRKVPYVTYSILAVNILVFASFWNYIFSYYPHIKGFLDPWAFSVSHPNLITLFTHAFIQIDPFHLLGNMLLLWLVGRVLEDGLGHTLFTLFYFASLVMATLLYGIIERTFMPGAMDASLIGASGAISGVMGLAAFRFYRLRVRTIPILTICCLPIPIPVKFWVPFWIYAVYFAVKEVYAGVMQISTVSIGHFNIDVPEDHVAHWAHIGGLLLGVLAAFMLDSVKEGKRGYALEDATKAVNEGIPANASMQQLEEILRERPNDPEVLEAISALAMYNGDQEKSRQFSIRLLQVCLRAHENARAVSTYLSLLYAFPDTVLPAKEQLAIASTLEGSMHYQESAQAFGLVIEHYPQSREAENALLRSAQLHHRYLRDSTSAKYMLEALLQDFPGSPWESLARERLREIEKNTR